MKTKSRKLDQFYTKKEIAKKCYDLVLSKVDVNKFKIIEPSAGCGSFSDLFHDNFLALDLDPKKDYIKKQDFLDFVIDTSDNIVIGNPPFGKNSSLAVKFFNKSAIFCEYICMIFPKTFRKDSIVNRLDLNFHLIEDIELPKNSFTFNDKEYDVPCVFQIWEKRNVKREKIVIKNKTKHFIFCHRQVADIAIRRVGGLSGKVIENFSEYKDSSHYFIKFNQNGNEIIKVLKDCYQEFKNKSKNTSGNPSLSKHELITIFENHIENS